MRHLARDSIENAKWCDESALDSKVLLKWLCREQRGFWDEAFMLAIQSMLSPDNIMSNKKKQIVHVLYDQ